MTCKHVFLMALICSMLSARAEDNMEMLKKRGLTGRVTYRVVDEAGSPITNATVSVYINNLEKRPEMTASGKTDTNGLFSVESRVKYDSMATVTKEGYYESWKRYVFFTIDQSRMKDGKWLPWNPTIDITLRPRIKPNHGVGELEMYVCHHLKQNTAYGFDMLKKDIVMSGKRGETADFRFTTSGCYTTMRCEGSRSVKTYATNILEITFLNDGDGLVKMKKRLDSKFQFTYLAPETGYEQKVRFNSDFSPQHRGSTFISDNNEYLIFRISRKDAVSGEIKRYYGIMTRLESRSGNGDERTFDIWYYLNPTPGDRNIEYGP